MVIKADTRSLDNGTHKQHQGSWHGQQKKWYKCKEWSQRADREASKTLAFIVLLK